MSKTGKRKRLSYERLLDKISKCARSLDTNSATNYNLLGDKGRRGKSLSVTSRERRF